MAIDQEAGFGVTSGALLVNSSLLASHRSLVGVMVVLACCNAPPSLDELHTRKL